MGYYTHYSIEQASDQAADTLRARSGYAWDDEYDLYEAKWYVWKKDLEATSLDFPEEVIILEGKGEEPGDIWKAYAKGGVVKKVQAKIVFEVPEF